MEKNNSIMNSFTHIYSPYAVEIEQSMNKAEAFLIKDDYNEESFQLLEKCSGLLKEWKRLHAAAIAQQKMITESFIGREDSDPRLLPLRIYFEHKRKCHKEEASLESLKLNQQHLKRRFQVLWNQMLFLKCKHLLNSDDISNVLDLLEKALKYEPSSPRFHGLLDLVMKMTDTENSRKS